MEDIELGTAFELSIYDGVYSNVRDGIMNALMETELYRSALQPVYKLLQLTFENAFDPTTGFVNMENLFAGLEAVLPMVQVNVESIVPALQLVAEKLGMIETSIYGEGGRESYLPPSINNITISGPISNTETVKLVSDIIKDINKTNTGNAITYVNSNTAGLDI
jgi:hypothetical protein